LVFLGAAVVQAETPGAGNLLGHRGMLRAAAAMNHPAGYVGLGTDFQYFTSANFLYATEDHARMVNTYSITWAPIRFIEAAFALHVTSDQSVDPAETDDDLKVAVGDPEVSVKGGYALANGLALGGLLDLRFPSGAGFFESSLSSTSVLFAALASYAPTRIPFGVHLNIGFNYDGSENLLPDLDNLGPAARFSAQVSSYHRFVTRLGAEYNTRYVGPFVELSLEKFVGGSNTPGFGDSPGMLSFGARVWPTKTKSFQLLAALDVGITGVSDGSTDKAASGGVKDAYFYILPRWNFLLRLSYRFDAYAKPSEGGPGPDHVPPPPPPEKPKTGVIRGTVVDSGSAKPVWNALVKVEGQEASSLAVNREDGSFRTFDLPVGKHTIVAEADGYQPARVEAYVKEDGTTDATLRLVPKTTVMPGTIRGTVKALVGKSPKEATILIPELDRTVNVDQSGSFSIQLKPGDYNLVVSAKGFRTQTKKITVREGSTVILNVELHKK
jgi:hypothetical protein